MSKETALIYFSPSAEIASNTTNKITGVVTREALEDFCTRQKKILIAADQFNRKDFQTILTHPSFLEKSILIISPSTAEKVAGIFPIPENSGRDLLDFLCKQGKYIAENPFPSLEVQIKVCELLKEESTALAYYRINFNFPIFSKAARRYITQLDHFNHDFLMNWNENRKRQAYCLLHSLKNQAGILGLSFAEELEHLHDNYWNREREIWMENPLDSINKLSESIRKNITLLENYLAIVPEYSDIKIRKEEKVINRDLEKILLELEHISLFRKIINWKSLDTMIGALTSEPIRQKVLHITERLKDYDYSKAERLLTNLKKELFDKGLLR